jgi:hypothetical protein
MSFRVVVVAGWLSDHRPEQLDYVRGFERALQSLADQPHLRGLAPESGLVNRDVR